MKSYLGIDTSNYTTSVCLYNGELIQSRRLLPVKQGSLGLRQSDAVFEHTRQLPELLSQLPRGYGSELAAIGVSDRPCGRDGSYMPCFLAGIAAAEAVGSALGIPVYRFTHQEGHIAAALYSSGRTDLFDSEFLVFHISGGTTELLKVTPSVSGVFNVALRAASLDLKMGQAVDRLGKLLGLPFPSGRALDELAAGGTARLSFPPSLKGADCSLSGFQNRYEKYLSEGEPGEDVARSFFVGLGNTLCRMAERVRSTEGALELVFSGGVASNSVIREVVASRLDNISFAAPELSRDNAAGIAVLAARRAEGKA